MDLHNSDKDTTQLHIWLSIYFVSVIQARTYCIIQGWDCRGGRGVRHTGSEASCSQTEETLRLRSTTLKCPIHGRKICTSRQVITHLGKWRGEGEWRGVSNKLELLHMHCSRIKTTDEFPRKRSRNVQMVVRKRKPILQGYGVFGAVRPSAPNKFLLQTLAR